MAAVGGLREVAREELMDVALDNAAGEDGNDLSQVFDGSSSQSAEDRVDHGCIASAQGASEEIVLPSQRSSDVEALHDAILERDAAIDQKHTQRPRLVDQVGQGSSER